MESIYVVIGLPLIWDCWDFSTKEGRGVVGPPYPLPYQELTRLMASLVLVLHIPRSSNSKLWEKSVDSFDETWYDPSPLTSKLF